jgi:hypothetical protein
MTTRRAAPEKPCCQAARTWVVNRLQNKSALAPLTGQDSRALSAFFHLVELYGVADEDGRVSALNAMTYALLAMQPSTRYLAKAGIPFLLDWEDEDRIWRQVCDVATYRTGMERAL